MRLFLGCPSLSGDSLGSQKTAKNTWTSYSTTTFKTVYNINENMWKPIEHLSQSIKTYFNQSFIQCSYVFCWVGSWLYFWPWRGMLGNLFPAPILLSFILSGWQDLVEMNATALLGLTTVHGRNVTSWKSQMILAGSCFYAFNAIWSISFQLGFW